MSWAVGYDETWKRDIGYGVPSTCDHPGCGAEIDRGLAFVCGDAPYGGEDGCGLFFCSEHRRAECLHDGMVPTPDLPEWIEHKLKDDSWQRWRDENPTEVAALHAVHACNEGKQAAGDAEAARA